jgi:hypothetical protein
LFRTSSNYLPSSSLPSKGNNYADFFHFIKTSGYSSDVLTSPVYNSGVNSNDQKRSDYLHVNMKQGGFLAIPQYSAWFSTTQDSV